MILQRSIPILNFYKLPSSPTKKFLLLPFNLSSSSSLASSALPITLSRFHPICAKIRAFATTAAAGGKERDIFFAEESVSWSSLGVVDNVSLALSRIGLNRPSLVQAASIPPILQGDDVIIAAETGSGKTHGYLVPLFHKLCRRTNDSVIALADEFSSQPRRLSLVLCPNVMLCEQVVRMANCICNENGEPLLRVAAVCGRQGWPVCEPNIIVSTPAALLNNLRMLDPEKRRLADFIRDVKHVVFDEADMLLCGSFQNQVIRLIDMLRFDEKLLARAQNSPDVKALGVEAESTIQPELEDHEKLQNDTTCEDDEEVGGADVGNSLGATESVKKKKDWRRARKIYERSKQYIFVAATLPENGKRTAGGELKRLFPDAKWISGHYLHRHNPRLEQKWIEVTVDTQVDALIDAVNHEFHTKSSNSDTVSSRTMVFANTVQAVEAVAKVLRRAGIECYCYHSDSPLEERAKNLVDFQQKGGVFVCTDAAARGIDIPNVSHVIQADFATSAVEFLHRVGRTGRAGQPGLVTSLYNESNRDLVAAVRQARDISVTVEAAFSRKRSFRNKLKKQGRSGGYASQVEAKVLA